MNRLEKAFKEVMKPHPAYLGFLNDEWKKEKDAGS